MFNVLSDRLRCILLFYWVFQLAKSPTVLVRQMPLLAQIDKPNNAKNYVMVGMEIHELIIKFLVKRNFFPSQ